MEKDYAYKERSTGRGTEDEAYRKKTIRKLILNGKKKK
jgi:hypothetical protein